MFVKMLHRGGLQMCLHMHINALEVELDAEVISDLMNSSGERKWFTLGFRHISITSGMHRGHTFIHKS